MSTECFLRVGQTVIGNARPTHHCISWKWIAKGPNYLCTERSEVPEDVRCSKSYASSDKRINNCTLVIHRVLSEKTMG